MPFQTLWKTANHGLRMASRSSVLYCMYCQCIQRRHTFFFASNVVFCRLHLATERVFPNFSVYGSDSVFQVSPNAPQYTDSGSYLKTKRMVSSCNLF